ncbi:MAG: hypothetical protein CL930_16290 [Deltaproteobacteria bacterium]|nr:hypothetical protein [Deltaproteobacteria bacterium]|tara:strand:- start:345 stop:548 length:204 start_codon:yes stop_codon:yes gene_type:complete
MALIRVHKLMIGTALVFCALFSTRAVIAGDTVLGLLFSVITVALGVYFRWFLKTKAESLPVDSSSSE